jgi:hypothetical protein
VHPNRLALESNSNSAQFRPNKQALRVFPILVHKLSNAGAKIEL